MKLIAIEEHFLTQDIADAWEAAPIRDGSAALNGGLLKERLLNLGEERLHLMDETGVDVQVLAPTSPGLSNLGGESVALARSTNDFVARTVATKPDRFQGLAVLPTFAPKLASLELQRAVQDLNLKGAILYGRTREKHLDHRDFWPIFESAEELNVPLMIHPQIPSDATRAALYTGFDSKVDLALSTFGLGWHYEAGIEFVRLVLAGVFDQFPRLQFILGHWGEVTLFYLERLAMLDRVSGLKHPFASYAQNNLYLTPSGLFFDEYLRRALNIVGIDRILFSTDYPYQYRPGRDARNFLESLSLEEGDKEKFAYANWERLTGASSVTLGPS